MGVFLGGVGGFLLGALLGYCAVLFGWLAYASAFDVFDADGGKIMGVAFGFAPMAAIVAGVVGAIWLGGIAARRIRRAITPTSADPTSGDRP